MTCFISITIIDGAWGGPFRTSKRHPVRGSVRSRVYTLRKRAMSPAFGLCVERSTVYFPVNMSGVIRWTISSLRCEDVSGEVGFLDWHSVSRAR